MLKLPGAEPLEVVKVGAGPDHAIHEGGEVVKGADQQRCGGQEEQANHTLGGAHLVCNVPVTVVERRGGVFSAKGTLGCAARREVISKLKLGRGKLLLRLVSVGGREAGGGGRGTY